MAARLSGDAASLEALFARSVDELPPSDDAHHADDVHSPRAPKTCCSPNLGIYFYSFAICLENVIVFPSMYPRLLKLCGGDANAANVYLGWAMAAFSAGRGVSAFALNLRENTPLGFLLAAFFCFACSATAAVLWVFDESALLLVLSRAVAGIGAGALSLMLQVLVASSSGKARTAAMSRFFSAAAVGEIIGPGLVVASASLNLHLGGGVVVDQNNVAGVYTLFIFVVGFSAVLPSYIRQFNAARLLRRTARSQSVAERADAGGRRSSRSRQHGAVAPGGQEEGLRPVLSLRTPLIEQPPAAPPPPQITQTRPSSAPLSPTMSPSQEATPPLSCGMVTWPFVIILLQSVMVNAGVAAWETVGYVGSFVHGGLGGGRG
jgi:MFS family permease